VSLDLSTQSVRAPLAVRGDDFYATPACAVRALLAVEQIPQIVWEPACGDGAIVQVLRDAGRDVIASDLVDRGCPDAESGVDFLLETEPPEPARAIVTNPPFKLAEPFVAHAIELVPEVHMLLRLAFLEGKRWRSKGFAGHLARVWVFGPRLPFMHRGDFAGKKTDSSAIPFAWFVFRRDSGRRNPPLVGWLNPREY
jgi:hypothetical protein